MQDVSKNVNIRDIAKLAGVSVATVSRALNNPDKVAEETKEKINSIIKETNYKPRPSSSRSSNIIVFFIGNIENLFYNLVLSNLTDIASKAGYMVMSCITNEDPEIEKQQYNYWKSVGCAGIVLTGFAKNRIFDANVPTVVLDCGDDSVGKYCRVTSDNNSIIDMLVNYLILLNHKKIGFITGGDTSTTGNVRLNLFLSHMQQHGLEVPLSYIYSGDFTIQSGLASFDYFSSLSDMPTAIIAANDEMAKGFIIKANSLGIKVPEDISICGVDAIDGDIFTPKITSVKQNIAAITQEVFSLINEPNDENEVVTRTVPVEFSAGQTCYKI